MHYVSTLTDETKCTITCLVGRTSWLTFGAVRLRRDCPDHATKVTYNAVEGSRHSEERRLSQDMFDARGQNNNNDKEI